MNLDLQQLQSQAQHYYQSLGELTEQRDSIRHTIKAIEDIILVKNRTILSPLTNGIFFETNVEEVKEFSVNVGNGIVVKKSPTDTLALMQEQLQEIDKVIENISQRLQETMAQMQAQEGSNV